MSRLLITLSSALILGSVVSAHAVSEKSTRQVDKLVSQMLNEQEVQANPPISDEVFLRRIYLDVIGRIPTPGEAEAFHAADKKTRRDDLIDELVESEGFVSHFSNYWADILRINNNLQLAGRDAEYAYRLWVKDSIRENKPYDQFVEELVSARGYIWENGAVGYYQRDRGMPLDNMSNTVRVFLGVRLECAQCHDHPFDKWTQMDYFKMAAFSNGSRAENYGGGENYSMTGKLLNERSKKAIEKATGIKGFPFQRDKQRLEKFLNGKYVEKQFERLGIRDEKHFRQLNVKAEKAAKNADGFRRVASQIRTDIYRPIQYVHVNASDRKLELPHDYQYDDAKPKSAVTAGTMFGDEIDPNALPEDIEKVDAYAEWMTSKDNPTFSKVIANRLWKRVFGVGVFEPVDELTDHTQVTNPRLMDFLVETMKDSDYDMKAFLKILYKSDTYQREAHREEVMPGLPYYFPGPTLRRMSAEQIWDSMVALAIPDADNYKPTLPQQLASIDRAKQVYDSLEGRSTEEFSEMMDDLYKIGSDAYAKMETLREKVYKAKTDENLALSKKYTDELRKLQSDTRKELTRIAHVGVDRDKDPNKLLADAGVMMMDSSSEMMSEETSDSYILTSLPKIPKMVPPADLNKNQQQAWKQKMNYKVRDWGRITKELMRASELRSPAPRGHFLREFGQSDRETIENANAEASVPQALNLLNSQTVEILANPFSVLGQSLEKEETPEDQVRSIFQSMLTRQPTEAEIAKLAPLIEENPMEARRDIIWALLNTQQFLFVL